MSTTTTNFGWTVPSDTDLVKDGAAAIRTALGGVDTSFVDLKGGTTGQVLSKASGSDLDFTWVAQDDSNAIQNAIVDAKGDLIAASAADTPARLAVGTDGQVLTADSSTATGLKWATAGGGGKVLQVVTAITNTNVSVSTTTFTDSNLTATITPTSSTSKIMVLVSQTVSLGQSDDTGICAGGYRLLRGATEIYRPATGASYESFTEADYWRGIVPIAFLDSPATTSATTYKTQIKLVVTGGGATIEAQPGTLSESSIILMEIGA